MYLFLSLLPCQILARLKGHQNMIRIVLNKADQVDKAKLRKVHKSDGFRSK